VPGICYCASIAPEGFALSSNLKLAAGVPWLRRQQVNLPIDQAEILPASGRRDPKRMRAGLVGIFDIEQEGIIRVGEFPPDSDEYQAGGAVCASVGAEHLRPSFEIGDAIKTSI
jgi:hypothetical protein